MTSLSVHIARRSVLLVLGLLVGVSVLNSMAAFNGIREMRRDIDAIEANPVETIDLENWAACPSEGATTCYAPSSEGVDRATSSDAELRAEFIGAMHVFLAKKEARAQPSATLINHARSLTSGLGVAIGVLIGALILGAGDAWGTWSTVLARDNRRLAVLRREFLAGGVVVVGGATLSLIVVAFTDVLMRRSVMLAGTWDRPLEVIGAFATALAVMLVAMVVGGALAVAMRSGLGGLSATIMIIAGDYFLVKAWGPARLASFDQQIASLLGIDFVGTQHGALWFAQASRLVCSPCRPVPLPMPGTPWKLAVLGAWAVVFIAVALIAFAKRDVPRPA